MNDELLILKKIIDKGKIAFNKNICIFTDFLNLNEQNVLLSNKKDLPPIKYVFFGGYEYSERKIIAFYPNYINYENINYPIDIIKISPKNEKYSNDLSHRDFLGAILNLGINRNKIGDIIVKNNVAYVFVCDTICNFILANLFNVKRTDVEVDIVYELPDEVAKCEFISITGTVSSVRLDSIIKLALKLSRGKSSELIKNGRVYINSKLIQSTSVRLNEGDVISVRGIGKFLFKGIGEKTKKDRVYVEINKFV